jgi:hypothetical protein
MLLAQIWFHQQPMSLLAGMGRHRSVDDSSQTESTRERARRLKLQVYELWCSRPAYDGNQGEHTKCFTETPMIQKIGSWGLAECRY